MTLPTLSPPAASPLPSRLNNWAQRIGAWLAGTPPAVPLDRAVAALLVHAARLGGPMEPSRRGRVADLLKDCVGLNDPGAAALIEAAESDDRRAVDIHHFVRVINRHMAQAERAAVFAMVARVALAGHAGDDEKGFLRLLGGLLGISDHDRAMIQHDVQPAA